VNDRTSIDNDKFNGINDNKNGRNVYRNKEKLIFDGISNPNNKAKDEYNNLNEYIGYVYGRLVVTVESEGCLNTYSYNVNDKHGDNKNKNKNFKNILKSIATSDIVIRVQETPKRYVYTFDCLLLYSFLKRYIYIQI
jgi:hypothetical protein